MTTLRFVGDLPAWLGVLLAIFGAVCAFAYYRRESFDLPSGLRWFLPLLRSLAILMVIVILTGPVLHHRQEVGQLGRVKLLVDTSQSMAVTDTQMPPSRKLKIANDQGWLPEGQFDERLSELAARIRHVRQSTISDLDGGETPEQVKTVRNRFTKEIAQIQTLIAAVDSAELVPDAEGKGTELRTRFQKEVVERLESNQAEGKDQLVALASRLAEVEKFYDQQFEVYCKHWIGAQGKAAEVGLKLFDQAHRAGRIGSRLLGKKDSLVTRLSEQHHVQLSVLVGDQSISIWNSQSGDPMPESLDAIASAAMTDLATGLVADRRSGLEGEAIEGDVASGSATILFSDGGHNTGPSPTQLARIAHGQGGEVYTVGYGTLNEPTDLAMLAVEYPDTIHKTDRVRGTMVLKDRMPIGQSFVVQISERDKVVWQDELRSLNIAERRVEFDFAVEELVDAANERFDADVKHHSVKLDLSAKIIPVAGETDSENNKREMQIAAVTQRQKVMLIDSRSRWETRYLKNLFERDSGWDLNAVILDQGSGSKKLPHGDLPGTFPETQTALFDYDLIFFGDVAPEVFSATETTWIRDFVDKRGGGMIFIDGGRGDLQRLDPATLGVLLPVKWTGADLDRKSERLELTTAGQSSPALLLAASTNENEELWKQLPAPHQISAVEPLPGAEVLCRSIFRKSTDPPSTSNNEPSQASNTNSLPAIVVQTFGGGRVLYFAFDETWRWRYRVADQYHQKFWNQVARWVMPRPYAISDAYLSLDSGAPRYAAGDTATIRARLRGPDGELVTDSTVDALLWRNERIVATVNLVAEDNMPGSYRSETSPLEPGDYKVTVRASGFSEAAFKASSEFAVTEPVDKEMQQIACNEALLRDLALAGGGQYLSEEDVSDLIELLEPLSNGRVIESDTLLWQSWPWFLGIIGLLSVEWFYRKRSGLL